MSGSLNFTNAGAHAERNRAGEARRLRDEVDSRIRRDGPTEELRRLRVELGEAESFHEDRAQQVVDMLDRNLTDAESPVEVRDRRERARRDGHAVASVRGRVRQEREAATDRAYRRLADAGGGKMNPGDWDYFLKATRSIASLDEIEQRLGRLSQRHHDAVAANRDPSPYEAGSPHSWVRDMLEASGEAGPEVRERLTRHGRQVVAEVRSRSEYGRQAERMILQGFRSHDRHGDEQRAKEEMRALMTGGGTTVSSPGYGAPFVPPAVLLSQWAPFRSPYRAFADQLHSIPLPDYGLEVYVPLMTGPAGVSVDSEGNAVTETDPSMTLTAAPVVPITGQVTVSQQLYDRMGPGMSADTVLFAQIREQLDAQVDLLAVQQALANAQAVTNTGSFALATASGEGGFLKDVKEAKSRLTDTAGVRLRATHLFASSDFTSYLAALADGEGRPIFTPTLNVDGLAPHSQNDPQAEGFTGYVIGGLALYADDNIPASGSNTQIVVARPQTILLAEGDPGVYVFPEAGAPVMSPGVIPPTPAGNLEAIIGAQQYVACLPRYPSGVSVITGAAYASSTFV